MQDAVLRKATAAVKAGHRNWQDQRVCVYLRRTVLLRASVSLWQIFHQFSKPPRSGRTSLFGDGHAFPVGP
jgi:hypothetical protein